jgi:uncharacterized protein YerC
MTHISRKKIKKDVADELADQFLTFLSLTRTKQDARTLARELLSQTERVMLAKRLAVVVLLVRGYTFVQIEETLGVSRQTVVRLWRETKEGRYEKIIRYARKHTSHFKKESFLDAFIRVIHIGMPPRAGKRWQQLDKLMGLSG